MKIKDERGMLSIEAVLILPIFLFAMLAIAAMQDLMRVHSIVQNSLTQTAREISAYCYVVSKTGIMDDSARLSQEAQAAKDNQDQMIDTVVKLYEAIDKGADNITNSVTSIDLGSDFASTMSSVDDAITGAGSSVEKISTAAETMTAQAESFFSDPKSILKGMLSIAKDAGFSAFKSYVIAGPISKTLAKSQIGVYGTNSKGQDILESLGVVDGLDGLNFSGSTLFNDGKTICVKCNYTVKLKYPFIETKEFHFVQQTVTEAWGSKHGDRPWRD